MRYPVTPRVSPLGRSTDRTPTGTFNFCQISPVVETENGNLYDDSRYPFDVVNENGETSNAMIEQWSLIDASTQATPRLHFQQPLSGVLDGITLRYPNSDSMRLVEYLSTAVSAASDDLRIGYPLHLESQR